MIRIVRGKFHIGKDNSIVVETSSGVGFEVFVPTNSYIYGLLEGVEVMLHTSMIMRENEVSLYGFDDTESLDLFETLITVNGVGAKAAIAIMSILTPLELKFSIGNNDIKTIMRASGVGKKLAERIVLELKDKIGISTAGGDDNVQVNANFHVSKERDEAINALMSLGYSKGDATSALSKVTGDGLSIEQYIKEALRNM